MIPLFETVWGVASQGAPVEPGREGELQPLTRWLRERGAATSGPEFVQAMARLQMLTRQWITRTAGYDAVLSPTLASPPVPVGHFTAADDPAEDFARQERFTPFTAVYNVTGQPAVSLPLHWTEATDEQPVLPIGVMLAGRPAQEATLIMLSAQLEDARALGGPPGSRLGRPDRRGGGADGSRVRYRNAVTVWETVLVFGVLPLACLGVLALLIFAPGATRTPALPGRPAVGPRAGLVCRAAGCRRARRLRGRPGRDRGRQRPAGAARRGAGAGARDAARRPHGHGEGWGQW